MQGFNPVTSLDREFEQITDYYAPRVVATANGQYLKLARFKGAFVWHSHAEEDELFLVHSGWFVMRYRDGEAVLRTGDCHVVPRGVEHCPYAEEEALVMIFEPAVTRHTGEVESAVTKSVDQQLAHLKP